MALAPLPASTAPSERSPRWHNPLHRRTHSNHTIRKVDTSSGAVSSPFGAAFHTGSQDGTGDGARFSAPDGLASDGEGHLYVADRDNFTIRRVTSGDGGSNYGGRHAGGFRRTMTPEPHPAQPILSTL